MNDISYRTLIKDPKVLADKRTWKAEALLICSHHDLRLKAKWPEVSRVHHDLCYTVNEDGLKAIRITSHGIIPTTVKTNIE